MDVIFCYNAISYFPQHFFQTLFCSILSGLLMIPFIKKTLKKMKQGAKHFINHR